MKIISVSDIQIAVNGTIFSTIQYRKYWRTYKRDCILKINYRNVYNSYFYFLDNSEIFTHNALKEYLLMKLEIKEGNIFEHYDNEN